ncbi:hypothetical protein H0264_26205 [Nocardia huaxiensis]|uniref:DUF4254 domain-containing protein n=1 Tax=Nocardia huaxiensis TaxID=2755382 RepID=A0A7D6ZLT8_9NOCA|nr:hypothetical protein [Nocardia huaxiensis]QLY28805.1 hypothetical protein H0264_26205 [Nocardia huaxiensis]
MKLSSELWADHRRRRLEPPAPTESAFPTGEALLSAIRNHHIDDHPLTRYANKLGTVHRLLLKIPGTRTMLGIERVELIHAIDSWARTGDPTRQSCGSLGARIDLIAETQVRAYHLLMSEDPGDPRVHAAWHDLAQLVDDYTCATAESAS